MQLPYQNHPYWCKDNDKAYPCNKYIGRGTAQSSTQFYADNLPPEVVNCGSYVQEDVVFISVEGNRRGRIPFDQQEVLKAIQANAVIVTDNKRNRTRSYNIGERELAEFLMAHSYHGVDHPEGAMWFPLNGDTTR